MNDRRPPTRQPTFDLDGIQACHRKRVIIIITNCKNRRIIIAPKSDWLKEITKIEIKTLPVHTVNHHPH